jgi:RimJ/RimL family protein N-acetyltransferase
MPSTEMMLPSDSIETERLVIRPFDEGDLDAAYAVNSDPEARRFTGGVVDRAESDRGLRKQIDRVSRTGLGARAVVERQSNQVIGYCGLQPFAETAEIELFYGYATSAWGRGFATEAADALIELGFRCLDAERLVAIVLPENVASLRVLEKLGFLRSGTYLHPRWKLEHLFLCLARRRDS